jgi:hypothetical protein
MDDLLDGAVIVRTHGHSFTSSDGMMLRANGCTVYYTLFADLSFSFKKQ